MKKKKKTLCTLLEIKVRSEPIYVASKGVTINAGDTCQLGPAMKMKTSSFSVFGERRLDTNCE